MTLSFLKVALSGLALTFALSGHLASAQTAEDDPMDLLDGRTTLGDDSEDANGNGLVPLFVPNSDAMSDEADADGKETDSSVDFLITREHVLLRGLDKITGQSTDLAVKVGEQVIFGGLRVSVRACHQTPPTEPPESIAYVEVEDYGFRLEESQLVSETVDKDKRVFHGWMYASSPGLHALEHPIYDVWVIRCMAAEPDLSEAGSKS